MHALVMEYIEGPAIDDKEKFFQTAMIWERLTLWK